MLLWAVRVKMWGRKSDHELGRYACDAEELVNKYDWAGAAYDGDCSVRDFDDLSIRTQKDFTLLHKFIRVNFTGECIRDCNYAFA